MTTNLASYNKEDFKNHLKSLGEPDKRITRELLKETYDTINNDFTHVNKQIYSLSSQGINHLILGSLISIFGLASNFNFIEIYLFWVSPFFILGILAYIPLSVLPTSSVQKETFYLSTTDDYIIKLFEKTKLSQLIYTEYLKILDKKITFNRITRTLIYLFIASFLVHTYRLIIYKQNFILTEEIIVVLILVGFGYISFEKSHKKTQTLGLK